MPGTLQGVPGRGPLVLAAVVLLGASGCGGRKLYPVEGQVVFPDGQPVTGLAGGSVEFDPLDGKDGARGALQADGTFRLETFKPGDGAYPGRYRVCVVPPQVIDRPTPRVIDRSFERFDTSGLQVEVKPENNRFPLTVRRAGPKP
jgi:hypothetical protein